MKISGIICEYNPLHNGHLYHLEQVRRNGADGIVAVMSGNFVQRGDAAILDKFTRARLAVQGGVDLVIELPAAYALAPAENFAMGGVALLTALGNVQEIDPAAPHRNWSVPSDGRRLRSTHWEHTAPDT